MVNVAFPGTIDERVITKAPKNVFQKNQNQTLALNAARSIGCQFVGIGAMDLINGEVFVVVLHELFPPHLCVWQPHLVLALLWQLIKVLPDPVFGPSSSIIYYHVFRQQSCHTLALLSIRT